MEVCGCHHCVLVTACINDGDYLHLTDGMFWPIDMLADEYFTLVCKECAAEEHLSATKQMLTAVRQQIATSLQAKAESRGDDTVIPILEELLADSAVGDMMYQIYSTTTRGLELVIHEERLNLAAANAAADLIAV